MTEKRSMFMTFAPILLAAAIPAGGVLLTSGIWVGGIEKDIERMEAEHVRRIQVVEEKQSRIGTVQVEQAKQSVAIEGLQEDVGEIKSTQKEISNSVEQSRREVNRLSREQAENFEKILKAVQE